MERRSKEKVLNERSVKKDNVFPLEIFIKVTLKRNVCLFHTHTLIRPTTRTIDRSRDYRGYVSHLQRKSCRERKDERSRYLRTHRFRKGRLIKRSWYRSLSLCVSLRIPRDFTVSEETRSPVSQRS